MRRIRTLLVVLVTTTLASPFAAAGQQTRASAAAADLPGVHLWFTDTGGSGTPIVLLHANTGTSANWEMQNAAFAKAGYRVIAFDRRGWGKTVADPATGRQPGTVAEDLDGLVKYLKLGKFHLVGVASGGSIALDYAAWRPETLLSVTVAASAGAMQEKEIADVTARFQLPGFAAWGADVKELSLTYRASNPDGVRKWLEIEEHAQQKEAPSQPLRTPNTYAKLESISTPTLVMAADVDFYAPPALMKLLAAHLKHSTWTVVPGAGHSVSWEQPEAFNKGILEFVSRHKR